MSAFLKALLYAAVAGGIASAAVGKPYEKHIRLLSALLCVALMVSPLLRLVPSLSLKLPQPEEDVSADSAAAAALIARQAAEDGERATADYIFTQTGIKVNGIRIQIESKQQTLHLCLVSATVGAAEQVAAVRDCLQQIFEGVPVEVSVGDG